MKLTHEQTQDLISTWEKEYRILLEQRQPRSRGPGVEDEFRHKSMERVIERYESMRPPAPELPQWRDPVLDPPTDADLDSDGEIAVLNEVGDVFSTDPQGLSPGCKWMSLNLLSGLPVKEYPPAGNTVSEIMERQLFEERFFGMDLRHDGDKYVNHYTRNAWLGWVASAKTER